MRFASILGAVLVVLAIFAVVEPLLPARYTKRLPSVQRNAEIVRRALGGESVKVEEMVDIHHRRNDRALRAALRDRGISDDQFDELFQQKKYWYIQP